MAERTPPTIYTTQACQRLAASGALPVYMTKEKRKYIPNGCWCVHKIGMELAVYTAGKGVLRTESVVNPMHAGAICLIPPDTISSHIPDGDNQVEYFNFLFLESELRIGGVALTEMPGYLQLKAFQSEGKNRLSQVMFLGKSLVQEIRELGGEIISAQTFCPAGWQYYCSATALYLLARIFQECRISCHSSVSNENRIEQCVSYMEHNCAEGLTLGSLARMAGMSPSSFSHLFKGQIGVSPGEYLIRCRLRKAVTMFAEYTDIGQIAAECGFSELSNFSRIFRQRLGMSAIQFRQLPIMEQMDAIHRIDTP